MDLKDYLIIIILIISINSIIYGLLIKDDDKNKLKYKRINTPKTIINIPATNMLDLQFSKDNWPTVIYGSLFTEANPFMGGYKLASKVIAPEQTGIATPPVTSPTGMLRTG
jgi:hypothetical protein